jgi:LacI family transcriptional regulator, repressor for deo operon, udp, cdd, tsx, nupC, and nupG
MKTLDRLSMHWESDIPLAQQLRRQLLWLITTGALSPGERLPPVRDLAGRLGINLHTVRAAYRKLEDGGLVVTRQGRGTYVLPLDSRRLAQIAATFSTHTVGVIIPSMANPFYHAFLQGVEEVASADGTLVFVCNTHDVPSKAASYYAQMAAVQVDGIIIASHDTAELAPGAEDGREVGWAPMPAVTVDWPECTGPSVTLDLQDAGYQASRHLLEHGHRRVGLITVAGDASNVRPVEAGYRRALGEAGLPADPAQIARVSSFETAAGGDGVRRLLALEHPPTSIFAIADTLALGALAEIKRAGLRVPHDIALAGFNDIPASGMVDPPLTSVAAPVREMGAHAMRMLQEQIAGRPLAQMQVVLPVALVVRASCGCPPPLVNGWKEMHP